MRQALFRAALVTVLVAAAWPFQPVMADDNLEYAVKAAYLVKFIPFIEWPDNAFVPGAPLTICILGGDPFGAVLDKAAAGQRLGDHALEVRRLPVMDPAQACQILFTADGQTAAVTLPKVRQKVGTKTSTVLGKERVTTYFDTASVPRWMGGGFGWGTYVADSRTDAFGAAYQAGRVGNDVAASATTSQILPQPRPDLVVDAIATPAQWRVGESVDVRYTVSNQGDDEFNAWTQELVRLVDASGRYASVTVADGATWARRKLAAGASFSQDLGFVVPPLAADGDWQLQVTADNGNDVAESDEGNNQRSTPVAIVYPDLTVGDLSTSGTLQGGETITLAWTLRNAGTAAATDVRDAVYLSRDGAVDAGDLKLGEVLHASIAAGGAAVPTVSSTKTIQPVDHAEAAAQVVGVAPLAVSAAQIEMRRPRVTASLRA